MYVTLMNYRMKTKFVLAIYSRCLTIRFRKCVLMYSLKKCFREGFRVSCFKNIVISAERYP